MAVLDWQKNTRQVAREGEAFKVAEEQQMLQQRWVEEVEAEKNMANQSHVINRARNQENIQHNEQEQMQSLLAKTADLQRDKNMLAAALARESSI